MHLIAFRRLQAGPLTATMEHRGGQDNDDGASSWLRRPGTGRGIGAGDADRFWPRSWNRPVGR
jgi:hypothetical protein